MLRAIIAVLEGEGLSRAGNASSLPAQPDPLSSLARTAQQTGSMRIRMERWLEAEPIIESEWFHALQWAAWTLSAEELGNAPSRAQIPKEIAAVKLQSQSISEMCRHPDWQRQRIQGLGLPAQALLVKHQHRGLM